MYTHIILDSMKYICTTPLYFWDGAVTELIKLLLRVQSVTRPRGFPPRPPGPL